MAFVTRSDREFKAGAGASGELGPGAYLGHDTYSKKRHGYAPFQSTTQREPHEETALCPAPGHYDPRLPGTYESILPKKYVPFKSTTHRFFNGGDGAKKNEPPGPGAYDIKGMCETVKNVQHPVPIPSLVERAPERSASAPSIPARAQCFGYEEGRYGKLVRQEAPSHEQPLAAIGPDHYFVDDAVVRKRVVGGHIPSMRQKPPKTATPGPGHYLERRNVGDASRCRRPGACFVSKVSRLAKLDKRQSCCPGPGQYNASLPSKPGQSDHQFFGSTVERFRLRNRMAAPGPGAYQVTTRAECAGGKLTAKTDRFAEFGRKTDPGPGQYETTEGFGLDAEKTGNCQKSFSVLGNQGSLAFGAMSRRFVKATDAVLESGGDPGPGAYEACPQKKVCHTQPSSFFKSRVPKDPNQVDDAKANPPPGAYDPLAQTCEVIRIPQKNEGFLTGTDRFRAAKDTEASIGPGQYNPELKGASTFNCAMGATCRGVTTAMSVGFTTCSSRFGDSSHNTRPGPGDYDLGSEWVKKSYNCLFGEVL